MTSSDLVLGVANSANGLVRMEGDGTTITVRNIEIGAVPGGSGNIGITALAR